MARDSSATKARILAAAFDEFAEYGIAGARVDRIADTAGANKRMIYVYYGNKEQLFDQVLLQAVEQGAESVPFDAEDLPRYAGAIFDHLTADPRLMRLLMWKRLERPQATAPEAESYARKTASLAAAQRGGHVDPAHDPADLLTLVLGLAQAWYTTAGGDPDTARHRAGHRAAVVDAVARLVEVRDPA
ncbi:TetR family transcriptional regulator [Streptomyces sp. 3211.6]|uniref:TetR family transcriptional regulator n=1 Tax=Streptomyces TaxID=1883 RepID=UPI0009A53785|nr:MULTISPECIES: TetR family transcriptional regulator [Streptomyces]RKT02536.1 TetR family transcriptional regulator [Streptomyces sp. 3211.6]RPF43861.1 TetR family transcriptional regulator [Streptomyces sp. Ag109_G2-6]